VILVIDNYDSFTFNLVQMLGVLHPAIEVRRNDAITPDEALALRPDYLVLSPGPGEPSRAGHLIDFVHVCGTRVPTLGVCLGHQAIAAAFGGSISRSPRLMHGKSSPVHHDGKGLFAGLPQPFEAGRYHSLIVDAATLPQELAPLAHSGDGDLMALRHRQHPLFGVQFHPESVLTPAGGRLLRNFLTLGRWKEHVP
jgi:anthranilate synthase/aminodeoxychorismate synthase-like glutamine amidotransferase